MRDPNRITKILDQISSIWRKYPDMRLGQLIVNSMRDTKIDPFYIEDETLLELILKFDADCERLKAERLKSNP